MAASPLPVEAAFVHYGTPHLTRGSVWALRTCYPHLPITVLDNGSPDGSSDILEALAAEASVALVKSATHLHHGPGMDELICRAAQPFVLLMDTDAFSFRTGVVEKLLGALDEDDAYMAGQKIQVWMARASTCPPMRPARSPTSTRTARWCGARRT